MYYMGFVYSDAYRLPVNERRWFIKRVQKEMKGKSDDDNPDPDTPLNPGWQKSRAPHHNTEDVRSLQDRARLHVPPRLIRFD